MHKWQRLAPLGLTMIGCGLSLLGDTIERKTKGASTLSWFMRGTVSLCVINAGIAVFGDAVKERALYEWHIAEQRQHLL